MVMQGTECLLMLKHSKGKTTTTLKTTHTRVLKPWDLPLPASSDPSNHAEKKKKRRKGNKQKKLEALLAYHQHLVIEKGLPPSRLMMQHAVAPSASLVQAEQRDPVHFQCDLCEFATYSQQGVNVHI